MTARGLPSEEPEPAPAPVASTSAVPSKVDDGPAAPAKPSLNFASSSSAATKMKRPAPTAVDGDGEESAVKRSRPDGAKPAAKGKAKSKAKAKTGPLSFG